MAIALLCHLVVAAGLAAASVGASAAAPPAAPAVPAAEQGQAPVAPTSLSLIAAMPPGTESVLVMRIEPLLAEGSRVAHYARAARNPKNPAGGGERDLLTVVYDAVAEQRPMVLARGASRMRAPRSIGVGAYDECDICWVRGSLAGLRERLRAGEDIEDLRRVEEVDGVEVFGATVTMVRDGEDRKALDEGRPPKEERFVAVVDAHTVVVASRREDAAAAVRGVLARREGPVPEQWRAAAAGLPLDAPLVILRRYDPTNELDVYSPENPRREPALRAGLDSLGLAVVDPVTGELRVRGVTPDAERAVRVLQTQSYLPRSDYAWAIEMGEGGFTADLTPRIGREEEGVLGLRLWIIWGPNVAM